MAAAAAGLGLAVVLGGFAGCADPPHEVAGVCRAPTIDQVVQAPPTNRPRLLVEYQVCPGPGAAQVGLVTRHLGSPELAELVVRLAALATASGFEATIANGSFEVPAGMTAAPWLDPQHLDGLAIPMLRIRHAPEDAAGSVAFVAPIESLVDSPRGNGSWAVSSPSPSVDLSATGAAAALSALMSFSESPHGNQTAVDVYLVAGMYSFHGWTRLGWRAHVGNEEAALSRFGGYRWVVSVAYLGGPPTRPVVGGSLAHDYDDQGRDLDMDFWIYDAVQDPAEACGVLLGPRTFGWPVQPASGRPTDYDFGIDSLWSRSLYLYGLNATPLTGPYWLGDGIAGTQLDTLNRLDFQQLGARTCMLEQLIRAAPMPPDG